jgi:cytochrome c oxidase subunit IV
MKNPPVMISVIGFFAALAGFGWFFWGLSVLGFDWFGVLGDLPAFEQAGLWGWLAIASGVVWLLAAFGLWAMQPWARLFVQIIAGFALFEAIIAMIQFTGTGIGLAMSLMPLLILWYLSTADVKAAFAENAQA